MVIRPMVPRIPSIEVYERMFNETKESGMKTTRDISFHAVVDTSGTSACRESAKRTTSATHVAVSSSEKSIETNMRCLFPKASLLSIPNLSMAIPSNVSVGDQSWIDFHTSGQNTSGI